MARSYAQYVGTFLVVLGLLSLVLLQILGEEPLLGLLNIAIVEDLFHIATGAILAYVGFRAADPDTVRTVVGVLGIVYLLVGVLFFISADLFDLLPSEYTAVDNLIHLAIGALGIAAAWFVGRQAVATT